MISQQRESAAGKLDPDLVASAGVEANVDKSGRVDKSCEFKACFFYTLAFFFYNIDLIDFAVFEQQILPYAVCGWFSVDQCPVFFHHFSLGHQF